MKKKWLWYYSISILILAATSIASFAQDEKKSVNIFKEKTRQYEFELLIGEKARYRLPYNIDPSKSVASTQNAIYKLGKNNGDYILSIEGKQPGPFILVLKNENGEDLARFQGQIKPQIWQEFGTQVMLWGSVLLMGIAVFVVARVTFLEEEEFKAGEKIEEAESKYPSQKSGLVLKYSRPFFKRYFTPVVSGMKNKNKFKSLYKRKLASAGLTEELSPEDFHAFKLFLIIGFPVVYIFLRWFLQTEGEEPWPISLVPVVAIIGYYYPNIWLKGKIEKRQNEVVLVMPFIVDMLALSVEAGLDTIAAISRVMEKAPKSPLRDEFEILLKEIKVGASRAEGLRNMAWRIDLIQVSSFCATLIAADSVGAPIPPILKSLSVEIRQKRSANVEKQGAKAATKILYPMIAFIVPAVIIVVFAPLLIDAFG